MSDDLDPVLRELEEGLRAAHRTLAPREGLEAEVRMRMRQRRELPWSGFSAAAAVLLAVLGVGFLLSRANLGAGAGTANSGAAELAPYSPTRSGLAFGPLPRPAGQGVGTTGTPDTQAGQSKSSLPPPAPLPAAAPVYQWLGTTTERACPVPPTPSLGGYPVLGEPPVLCLLNGPLRSALYRLAPAPKDARLVYVWVPDGAAGYFEPAYQLAAGGVESALTQDELRP